MIIKPLSFEEALDLVYNVLNQGDSRYNAPENEEVLANFLLNSAIILEEKNIPSIDLSKKKLKDLLTEVQWSQKFIAKELLKLEGFKEQNISFEKRLLGYQPDILAKSESKFIVVECCSCKTKKVIDFLEEVDEVWVITKGYTPEENPIDKAEAMMWFVFRKGKNWKRMLEVHKKEILQSIKNIKDPLDRL